MVSSGRSALLGKSCPHGRDIAAGNMTSGPKPGEEATRLFFVYDAWNRLAAVWEDQDADGEFETQEDTLLAKYGYDGLHRRTHKAFGSGQSWVTQEYYYSTAWQLLEMRVGASQSWDGVGTMVIHQYLWDPRYIDAAICRDADKDADGDCAEYPADPQSPAVDEHLFYCQDANFNVTGLWRKDSSGADWHAVERYHYDPYGRLRVLNGETDLDGSGLDWLPDWNNEADWPVRVLYCGYLHDYATGLYLVRHRALHPTLGRWMQRDPAVRLSATNAYAYANSRPPNTLDPLGLYTIEEVHQWIMQHGDSRMRFELIQLKRYRVRMYVKNSWWFHYDGEEDHIWIDCDAKDMKTAAAWFEDGTREWAYHNRYGDFRWHVRGYAKQSRERKNDAVGVLADTYDFIHKFSKYASSDPSDEMLNAEQVGRIGTMVFANTSLEAEGKGAVAAVDTKNGSLSKFFWDMTGARLHPDDDQTHHFAFYFEVGTRKKWGLADAAAYQTGDTAASNPGDYLLAKVAAQLGWKYAEKPDSYPGAAIRTRLTRDPQEETGAAVWNTAITAARKIIDEFVGGGT